MSKIRQLLQRGWMIRLKSSEQNFDYIISRLRENSPFTFSRWGDGEWEAVLNLKKADETNCDGHQFFDVLCDELKKILIKKVPYMLGMQPLAYHKLMGRKIDKFLKSNNIKPSDLWWVDADVFHNASTSGKIYLLFDELKKKKILLVGPEYLTKLKTFPFDFVEVPLINCWNERDRIMKEIKEKSMVHDYDAVLFCAGMTSNWMIDQLHGKFDGFILDVGSLFDPFAGKNTRNYHKKLGSKYQGIGK